MTRWEFRGIRTESTSSDFCISLFACGFQVTEEVCEDSIFK
jgi:hypothetical protein